ncbi:DUF2247 family protein [Nocardia sp. NPDC024068]|uniref:DUF2247 family protein n=1 Tax=Nocardia sp. NPDC024068 TaxID=3157197 RepID=UPI0033E83587
MKFSIPGSFVAEWARLTPGELRYGYEHEWITGEDAVTLALSAVVPSDTKMGVIEDISLLLSDELYRLPELMDELAQHDDHVWVYLAIAWVHENPDEFEDPFGTVEDLYADFDYPDDVAPFVRYMPPPTGSLPGMLGMRQRWRRYLSDGRDRYMARAGEPPGSAFGGGS